MKRAQYLIVNAHIYLYISVYGNLHICRYIEKPIFPFPDENEKFGFGNYNLNYDNLNYVIIQFQVIGSPEFYKNENSHTCLHDPSGINMEILGFIYPCVDLCVDLYVSDSLDVPLYIPPYVSLYMLLRIYLYAPTYVPVCAPVYASLYPSVYAPIHALIYPFSYPSKNRKKKERKKRSKRKK